ncbi:MAG: hypothetical protein LUD47_00515 [Clostridia bacterium]|nr:hypothetical protein [Clostridia bacterium]
MTARVITFRGMNVTITREGKTRKYRFSSNALGELGTYENERFYPNMRNAATWVYMSDINDYLLRVGGNAYVQ